MRPFYVYLVRCADGSYYCGQTDDIQARMQQHSIGEVGYTSTRKPVELVWQGEFETREGAIAFEQQIKGWSRAKKEALIAGDWARVQEHARSKGWEGLRQAQPERGESETSGTQVERGLPQPEGKGLRQAQPERGEAQSERGRPQSEREGLRQAQPERGPLESSGAQVERGRPQPEGKGLRQAQPERGETERAGKAQLEWASDAQPERASNAQPKRASIAQPERALVERVLAGDAPVRRRAVAKAITLLESTRADHRAQADELLTALLPHAGNSFRLGISGVPGVGKSTFIEALGLLLIGKGHRVAVLAIDPSSTVSGGSILGDKTRMEKLSAHDEAYIRPSPSGGTLGGVAEKTREAMLVCEAAGYDIVIVETVGVGQSETAVAGMTDMFVLLQLPNAGDDLQAIKKGVMELADLIVINKADLDANAATRAQAQVTSALRLFGQHGHPDRAHHDQQAWRPRVIQLSALLGQGVDRFWDTVQEFRRLETANGRLGARRRHQALAWMWERIDAGLKQAFRQHPQVRALLPALVQQVEEGSLAASTAARRLLAAAAPLSSVRAEPVEAHANDTASPSTGSGRTKA